MGSARHPARRRALAGAHRDALATAKITAAWRCAWFSCTAICRALLRSCYSIVIKGLFCEMKGSTSVVGDSRIVALLHQRRANAAAAPNASALPCGTR